MLVEFLVLFNTFLSLSYTQYFVPPTPSRYIGPPPFPMVTINLSSVSVCLLLFLLYSLVVVFFSFHIWVITYSTCLFPFDLFHVGECSPSPPMLLQMAGIPPFYGWAVFHYMYHILLTHSLVDGCSGCFHVLAVVNNAAWTLGCMYLFQVVLLFFWIYIPKWSCWLVWYFYLSFFWENCFLQWLQQFTSPPTMYFSPPNTSNTSKPNPAIH